MKIKSETVSPDYQQLLDNMSCLAASTIAMAELQAEVDQEMLDQNDQRRDHYADLQTSIADFTAAIERLCRSHPEWFLDSQSLKTPFGTAKFRASTALEVPDEAMSIILLEKAAENDPSLALAVKTTKALNREVLEKLDDTELKRFRIRRIDTNGFSVKPAKVDLGKAVSAGEETEKAGLIA